MQQRLLSQCAPLNPLCLYSAVGAALSFAILAECSIVCKIKTVQMGFPSSIFTFILSAGWELWGSKQEASTKPEQSLITTLIPDLFSSEKTAPSRLIFTMSAGGTSQKFLLLLRACLSIHEAVEVDWQATNSACLSLDSWAIWFPNTILLVGCCSDEITHKYKGKTVMTEDERYESLRHCNYAYASGAGNDVYEFVKSAGRFKETKRADGISTSDIIMRIVKDYNQYVMRNLDRGYSRKDLGVSYEKRLRVNMRLKKLQEKVKEQQEKVGEKIQTVAMHRNEWVENADRWVAGFLEMFEEGCHKMGTAIRDRIQERLRGQASYLLQNGQEVDDDDEEYYDDDDDDEQHYDDGDYYYYEADKRDEKEK
uniref:Uncharacterized protein n=1 Tax=Quercus lobata TaxID=97700 RepID=A0A7N2LH11_QUELO